MQVEMAAKITKTLNDEWFEVIDSDFAPHLLVSDGEDCYISFLAQRVDTIGCPDGCEGPCHIGCQKEYEHSLNKTREESQRIAKQVGVWGGIDA